jgi:prepilin-type N-terminal cleavage/methylation domain-containing protein
MKTASGFTLIELMIVLAVIALIAAIAVPNMLRSRMSANEAGAAGAMRTISSGEAAYQSACLSTNANGTGQYADLPTLAAPPSGEPFIDDMLGNGVKQGYNFAAAPGPPSDAPAYQATAQPINPGKTGVKSYFVDQSGVIRFEGQGAVAGPGSPPLS